MKSARFGIEDVTCSDRISQLPDDLLYQILSLVPISDAMSTSLLSKRWKSLWKMMPTLEYDADSCLKIGSFGFHEFVSRSLQLHEAPVLKTLNIKLRLASHSSDDSLIFQSIRSTPLEITISSCNSYYNISFPKNLRIFQKLLVLKLQGKIRLDVVGSPICFRSLKILHLTRVKISCEKSLSSLLSACPVLEDLSVDILDDYNYNYLNFWVHDHDPPKFTISVPSLQRLFIHQVKSLFHNNRTRFEINTPSLKYLEIPDGRGGCLKFVEDMPKLLEANVKVDHSETEELLRFLTSVERLSIHLSSFSMVMCFTDKIFNRLLHLELHFDKKLQWDLILSFLKHSPNLQILKLNQKPLDSTIKNQWSSVPECLTLHLETLKWLGYAGTPKEKASGIYILENASRTSTAKFARSFFSSVDSNCWKKDLMIMNELESISKASLTSCQLVIQLQSFS